jgi:hypothetical protein
VQKHVALLQRAGLITKQRRQREHLVRTDPDTGCLARQAPDQLEIALRGRVEWMSQLLARDPGPQAISPTRGQHR